MELEFYPSVGILVLGTLHAQGNIDRNIIMRPVKLSQVRDYRIGKHHIQGEQQQMKKKVVKRSRSYKHLRITEEEDFDVRY